MDNEDDNTKHTEALKNLKDLVDALTKSHTPTQPVQPLANVPAPGPTPVSPILNVVLLKPPKQTPGTNEMVVAQTSALPRQPATRPVEKPEVPVESITQHQKKQPHHKPDRKEYALDPFQGWLKEVSDRFPRGVDPRQNIPLYKDMLIDAYAQYKLHQKEKPKAEQYEIRRVPTTIAEYMVKGEVVPIGDLGDTMLDTVRNKIIYNLEPGANATVDPKTGQLVDWTVVDVWNMIASYDDVHVVVVPIDVRGYTDNPLGVIDAIERRQKQTSLTPSTVPKTPLHLFWQEYNVTTAKGYTIKKLQTVPNEIFNVRAPNIARYDFRIANVKENWEKPLYVFACALRIPDEGDQNEAKARQEVLCDLAHIVNATLDTLQTQHWTKFKSVLITGSTLHLAEEFSVISTCIEKMYRRPDVKVSVSTECLYDMLTAPELFFNRMPANKEEALAGFDDAMFTEICMSIFDSENSRFNKLHPLPIKPTEKGKVGSSPDPRLQPPPGTTAGSLIVSP